MGSEPSDETLSLYEYARDGNARKLISYLENSTNPKTRGQAAEKLGELITQSDRVDTDHVIDALITSTLEDPNEDVQARAAGSLDRRGSAAIPRLIARLSEAHEESEPDRPAQRTFIQWLDSEHSEIRLVAASGLTHIGDERVVPYLVTVFDDLDPRVRERAIRACGQIGDPRSTKPVAARLSDREPLVQRAAADALATIGTTAARKRLIPAARAADKQTRYTAVSELGHLKSTEPLEVLTEALTDDSHEIRRAATLSAIELLTAETSAATEIRDSVRRELATIDDTELIERLLDILADTTRLPVQRAVVWLLGRSISPEADRVGEVHDRVLTFLDTDPLADTVEDSLLELESRTLEDRLLAFTQQQDPSPEARQRAEAILDRIETNRIDERIRESVEYVYIQDPADYTRKKEAEQDQFEQRN